jgi:hypothetical protein
MTNMTAEGFQGKGPNDRLDALACALTHLAFPKGGNWGGPGCEVLENHKPKARKR